MSNEVQRPVFASASGQQGDDFDLNEIFADYFISEFEDPHNAYTNAMANYVVGTPAAPAGPASAAVAAAAAGVPVAAAPPAATMTLPGQPLAAAPGVGAPLPTSGIRTAYHTAVVAPPQAPTQQQILAPAPVAKKPKIELGTFPTATVAATGGITSRLGVPMPLLQQNGTAPGTQAAISQLSAAAAAAAAQGVAPAVVAGPGGGVSLPVGVGIRLGGAGGVAPSTAQNAARVGGIMWGGPQVVGMTDQAIAERRQRNREHAKRSRVRKKFMLESLQEQVSALQRENQRLRLVVQDNIPQHAQKIIAECCTSSPLFSDEVQEKTSTVEVEGVTKDATALVRSDFQLMDSLSAGQQNFVLSDPRLPDNPIVFATPGFYKLTGYTPEQVLGRNCRFLQGPGTDPKAVDIIRKAIATGSDCTVCLLNYKADGTPFWNQFFVAALRDSDNCIVNYVGVQTEIEPDAGANALEDRVNAVLPLADKDEGEGDGGNEGQQNEQQPLPPQQQ